MKVETLARAMRARGHGSLAAEQAICLVKHAYGLIGQGVDDFDPAMVDEAWRLAKLPSARLARMVRQANDQYGQE